MEIKYEAKNAWKVHTKNNTLKEVMNYSKVYTDFLNKSKTERSCAKEIINLIENDGMRELIIENCKNTNYSNKDEIKKIYNLIGNR